MSPKSNCATSTGNISFPGLEEIQGLKTSIADLEETASSDRKINRIIVSELREVIKKYSQPRKSLFIYPSDLVEYEEEDETPDYTVNLFVTREGYVKKITPQVTADVPAPRS